MIRRLFTFVALACGLLQFAATAQAATYTFSGTSFPACSSNWSQSGSTWLCPPGGTLTLAAGDKIQPATSITIEVEKGITLNGNNTIGSATVPVHLKTTYGDMIIQGTSTLYGNLITDSGSISLTNSTLQGNIVSNGNLTLTGSTITGNVGGKKITTTNTIVNGNVTATGGAISLTGGRVAGTVYSNCCAISTTNTNIDNGVRSDSNDILINGGTIAGAIYAGGGSGIEISNAVVATSNIAATSSIGTSTVPIKIINSTVGSPGNPVNVTGQNPITITGSTVYGDISNKPSSNRITIDGDTTIYGNVSSNNNVTISGTTDVYGNVTGGNWSGTVTVNTTSTVWGVCSADQSSTANPNVGNTRCDGAGAGTLNHIRIEHTGSGLTCAASTLTLKACADASCSSLYTGGTTGTLTASGGTVTWIGGAGFSIGTTGTTTKSVQPTAAGMITWGVSGATPYCDNTSDGTAANAGAQCQFTAATAGFIVSSSTTGAAATVPAQTAGMASGTYYLRAVIASTANPAVCTPAIANQNDVAVHVGYTCNNPASCQTGNQLTVNTSAVPATGGSVAVNFDANGSAPITLRYDDVGRITVNASKSITPTGGSAVTLSGGTNAFVVKPARFSLAATCADGTANTASQTSPGPGDAKFCRAGQNFSVVASARNQQGNATPNYGKEATPETLTITWTRHLPASGSDGTLPNGTPTFTGSGGVFGTANNYAWSWNEVGILKATVAVGGSDGNNYLGAGGVSTDVYIGRFYPNHFDVALVPQCGGFAYSGRPGSPAVPGQPFTVTATAKNVSDGTTQNYSDSSGFAKNVSLALTSGSATGALYAGSTASGTNALPKASFTSPGIGTVAHNAASNTISYIFTAFPAAPATISLRAFDADTSPLAGSDETVGSTVARSGRLRLFNAYGSDVLPLRVPAQVEYFAASGRWTVNSDDNCTQLQPGMIGLGNRSPAGMTTTVGTVAAAGNGRWSIVLKPSVPPSAGSVDLAVNLGAGISAANACLTAWSNGPNATTAPTPSLTHLAGQWCGTSADKAPLARARFGSPKAPYIYLRERY